MEISQKMKRFDSLRGKADDKKLEGMVVELGCIYGADTVEVNKGGFDKSKVKEGWKVNFIRNNQQKSR